MKKNLFLKFEKVLSSSKKIIIIPHKNPDGDALGSAISLNLFLNKTGHQSQIISPNDYPDFLKWLPAEEEILKFSHQENPSNYSQISYSDPSIGSTCEMVFNLLYSLNKVVIDRKIATCLYTGIMTDSGSFRFPSTTHKTHQIISKLIQKGANPSEIHQKIYDCYTLDRLQLLGVAIFNLKKIKNLPVVYITLSQKELNQNNFKKGDTEGFVNYGLCLKGIKLAVIMIENQQDKIIKLSFRSKGKFDVNNFAKKYFNGGGHINAAGGISNFSLKKTESNFLSAIEIIKKELNA